MFVGGVRSSRFWSANQLIPPSGQQLHHSSGVCLQIQGRQCGSYVGEVKEMMCVVLQRGHSGNGCVLASTLCKYDLRKSNLFVLSWARMRRVMQGSLSSEELLMGGGCELIILLLPLVDRCLETIDICIWHMFSFMSVVVTVWRSVGMFVV